MSKFKVGDKVTGVNLHQCMYGEKARVIKIVNFCGKTGYILDEFPKIKWWEDELKLIEPATTEFTFEEVIARIKEGEVYQNSLSSISKIDGCIEVVSINRSGRTVPKGEEYIVRFETNNYKLVPQKNNYLLFEVEHQEGGKRYLFRSDCNYNLGDIVICQTSLGKSYGKIVYKVIKELTEEEFKAYKPIIKSV